MKTKKIDIVYVLMAALVMAMPLISACGSAPAASPAASSAKTQVVAANAADGLDLKALGGLVAKAKNAEDLERMLNTPGSINNLDLDEDGNVDYLKVQEFGDDKVDANTRGFSITDELAGGQVQEIATVYVSKAGTSQAQVQVQGSQNVYGQNMYYNDTMLITELLLWSYLWAPHPYYISPYRYGYYPSYYAPYGPVPLATYRTVTPAYVRPTMKQSTSSAISSASKLTSPNAGKTADSIKAPLSNPTQSQKAFQERNPSKSVGSGGFGGSAAPSNKSGSPATAPQAQPNKSNAPVAPKSGNSGGGSSGGKSSGSSFGGGRR